jgi:hypothetical protein
MKGAFYAPAWVPETIVRADYRFKVCIVTNLRVLVLTRDYVRENSQEVPTHVRPTIAIQETRVQNFVQPH